MTNNNTNNNKPSFWNTPRGFGVMCLLFLFAGSFIAPGVVEHRLTKAAETCVEKGFHCFIDEVCVKEKCKEAVLMAYKENIGACVIMNNFESFAESWLEKVDTKLEAFGESSLTKMEAFAASVEARGVDKPEAPGAKMELLTETLLQQVETKMEAFVEPWFKKIEAFAESLFATANAEMLQMQVQSEIAMKMEPLFAAMEAVMGTKEKTTSRDKEVQQELQTGSF